MTVDIEAQGSASTQRGGRASSAWSPAKRWNFFVLGADMSFFSFGLAISSAYTVMPLFINHLTSSTLAIAMIPAVRNLGMYAPALLVAPLIERRTRALPLILRLTVLERVPYLLLWLAALLLADTHPGWMLAVFFAMIFLAVLGSGLTSPGWLDMIARSVPSGWIGRFFGIWTGLGGVLGVGGAALAAAILARLAWPANFALCFLLTFATFVVSFVLLAMGEEVERPEPVAASATAAEDAEAEGAARNILAELPAQARSWWLLLKGDTGLQRLLATNCLTAIALIGGAFFAVAALGHAGSGGLTVAEVGAESTTLFVGSTGGNFLWGSLGDHFGHRAILIYGTLCAGAAAFLALVASGFLAWGGVFLLFGLALSATQLASFTFITEFGPPERRPTYIALASVAYTPFAVGAPLVGGWLADRWGFGLVFILAGVAGLVAAALYLVVVPDPRQRQEPTEHITPAREGAGSL